MFLNAVLFQSSMDKTPASIVTEDPSILYLVSYPNPSKQLLEFFSDKIRERRIDILVVETLMSGKVPTMYRDAHDIPMIHFAIEAAHVIPTFFLPHDSKPAERRPNFYMYDALPFGIVPLDAAYSLNREEPCQRMIDIWKENPDPSNLVRVMRREYAFPGRDPELTRLSRQV